MCSSDLAPRLLPSQQREVSLPERGGRHSQGCGTTTGLTLHCCPQEERPPYHRYKKGSSVGGLCYLSMGMVVLLMGLVFASVYIYRYFFLAQVRRGGGRRGLGERVAF